MNGSKLQQEVPSAASVRLNCPRCGSVAVSQLHRNILERILTGLTPYRKWDCDPCGYHWLGKAVKAEQWKVGREETWGDMVAYRFADARSLYAIIDGVEALIMEGDWIAAGPHARRIRDEAEYQKSEAANKNEWRPFLNHATNLEVAVRAQDRAGCVEEVAAIRLTLSDAAGPERKE